MCSSMPDDLPGKAPGTNISRLRAVNTLENRAVTTATQISVLDFDKYC